MEFLGTIITFLWEGDRVITIIVGIIIIIILISNRKSSNKLYTEQDIELEKHDGNLKVEATEIKGKIDVTNTKIEGISDKTNILSTMIAARQEATGNGLTGTQIVGYIDNLSSSIYDQKRLIEKQNDEIKDLKSTVVQLTSKVNDLTKENRSLKGMLKDSMNVSYDDIAKEISNNSNDLINQEDQNKDLDL